MEKKIINEVMEFTPLQIEKQLSKQVDFLKRIYPWLEDDEYQEGCIELRPIKRDKKAKYVRSFNFWRMLTKDEDELKKFLTLINGKGYCLYYSIFTFDYDVTVNSKKRGMINKENALYTSMLGMDFDDITENEFKDIKKIFTDIGIETVDIFSGHGYQSLILLKEKVFDKEILKKFTDLLISRGIKADPSIGDCARIFRMPFSFNCKSLDEKDKHFNEGIIPTKLIADTDRRYHLVDVFKAVNSLDVVIKESHELTDIDIALIKTETLNKVTKEKKKKEQQEIKQIKIESLSKIYSDYLNIERLPEPVVKMLQGVESGFRNKVLMFIIPFFRNSLGLSLQKIKSILIIWGERCIPEMESDFVLKEVNRIFKYDFKGGTGKYSSELSSRFGYLEFNEFKRVNKVLISNEIFEDFEIINDGAIKIYLAMKLEESITGVKQKEFTGEELLNIAYISESTLRRNIKDLVNLGYINKKRKNRRNGEVYIYSINTHFNISKGYTLIENSILKLMINELTDGEMKLYSYLCMMINTNQNDCWASQKYLAKRIGKKGQSSISKMTDSLVLKRYILKRTIKKNGILNCVYNLNY